MKSIFIIVFSFLFNPYFGKNKIQYKKFNWEILETEHFDIYYYQGEKFLAKFASVILEQQYDYLASILQTDIENPIPVIIYNSYSDFKQTNVTLQIIEEATGGFSEILKNRIVVAFNGSYDDFEHVLKHELVHIFQFQIFYRDIATSLATITYNIPLWIIEGSAEYLSIGWDETAESFIRDLMYNNMIINLEELSQYGGYIVYKEGQAFFKFIDDVYGKEKITELFQNISFRKNFNSAIKKTFGKKIEDLNEDFIKYLKKKYYPLVGKFDIPDEKYRRITNHTKLGGFIYRGNAISDDGSFLAILCDKSGLTDVYLVSTINGEFFKKLISGETSVDFEQLHLFRPSLDINKNEFIISVHSKDKDKIFIYDLNSYKQKEKLTFELNAIYTPKFSPSGRYIVFTGIKNGKSDLYLYDREKKELKRLTNDFFDDRDPSFSKDEKKIIFVSDRNQQSDTSTFFYGSYALFEMDLEKLSIKRITPYIGKIHHPFYLNENEIIFTMETDDKVNQIVLYKKDEQKFYKITNLLTSINDIDIDNQNRYIAFSCNWQHGYDVFVIKNALENKKEIIIKEKDFKKIELYMEYRERVKYSTKFTLDWFYGGLGYSSIFGYYGGLVLSISDILGNHRIIAASDLQQEIENSNFFVSYSYLPFRTDLNFTIRQYWDLYIFPEDYEIINKIIGKKEEFWTIVFEKNFGTEFHFSYPLDKFKRIDFGIAGERKEWFIFEDNPDGEVYTSVFYNFPVYLSFVTDKTLFSWFGPLKGYRGIFYTSVSTSEYLTYLEGLIDLRRYISLGRRTLFAIRGLGGINISKDGKDGLPYWIGGPFTLRGYPEYSIVGTRLALLNIEFRYPLIDRIKFGFPIEIRYIRGLFFIDLGYAWFSWEKVGLNDIRGGVGWGVRFPLYIAILRIDVAKPTNFKSWLGPTIVHITFGLDF